MAEAAEEEAGVAAGAEAGGQETRGRGAGTGDSACQPPGVVSGVQTPSLQLGELIVFCLLFRLLIPIAVPARR